MNFDMLKKQFQSYDARIHGMGASEEEIRNAEQRLGVTITGSFRQFLATFGWGGVNSLELYGLGRDVPHHLNLMDITLSERTEMMPHLPPELVPVMNDGGGNLYCIDTTRCEAGENPVVFWDHDLGPDQIPEFVSISFGDWLSSVLSETMGR